MSSPSGRNQPFHAGRHFLQIPGPTNVPDAVLRAIDAPTMDHRGPAFGELGHRVLGKLRTVFRTASPVVVYPASGTGAWEAALVNTLSPGDSVLMCRTGWFATLWQEMAERLQLKPVFIETDWRRGADVAAIGEALAADRAHRIRAVCVVHNETSTGCTSRIDEVRAAIDAAGHPALLMVDTISSLGSIDYRHDEWGVDVTIAGSQKGLMLPPGLSFNAVSDKALEAGRTAKLPRSYWDWRPMLAANADGYFPYTPSTNLLYGLDVALDRLLEEGLEAVFARHDRHAAATRIAVAAWGLEVQCADARHYSSSLTAVRLPEGHSADALRAVILERFNMSLGNGLGQLRDRVFRIGHLGDLADLTLVGTLGGVEMGLALAAVPYRRGGTQAAMASLAGPTPQRSDPPPIVPAKPAATPSPVIEDTTPMIEVWSWPTPNGHKVHIALEELGLPYTVVPVDIGAGDQFKPDFLAITPNHRIPAIVDPDGPGGERLALFESGAILIYLAEKTGKLIPGDPAERYACLQWLMFQMGGIGPMFGQYNHFANYAAEKLPYAVERYTNEVARLHRVLDKRLAEVPYLAGGDYTIADIANFAWIRNPDRRGIDLADYPHVRRWHDAIAEREAVQRGVAVLSERQRKGPITDAQRDVMFGARQFANR